MGNCWAGAGAVLTVAMGTSILPWSTGDCVCTDVTTEKPKRVSISSGVNAKQLLDPLS